MDNHPHTTQRPLHSNHATLVFECCLADIRGTNFPTTEMYYIYNANACYFFIANVEVLDSNPNNSMAAFITPTLQTATIVCNRMPTLRQG